VIVKGYGYGGSIGGLQDDRIARAAGDQPLNLSFVVLRIGRHPCHKAYCQYSHYDSDSLALHTLISPRSSNFANLSSMYAFTRGHPWVVAEVTAYCGPDGFGDGRPTGANRDKRKRASL